MKVVFIGVGNMGLPMAANLVRAGHEVRVCDADIAKASSVAAQIGAGVLSRMNDIATAEIVVTMLPDGRVVRDVLLGEAGVASFAQPGTVVIDMSSSQPLITRETGQALVTKGITLIDAPVSGGVERAIKGTLTIMIGGDDAAVIARAKILLSCLGTTFFEVGKLGSGHAAKALNNVVAATNYAALAESLLVAKKYGIDSRTLVDIISTSTGQSFISSVVMKQFVVPETYNSGFKVGLLSKDVTIAAELSTDLGCVAPFIQMTKERWDAARDVLGADADHSKAILAWWQARRAVPGEEG
ncbi:MAG TPA: NAD(P)-dependent oxidoreductase [Steroidobacteraceae bacterium]|jgi:3-hydroxyisobutyrate dehydrogenase|nr:NAD(P)-dependent oxidoreductase [Steroidobacteraceae bacterium]